MELKYCFTEQDYIEFAIRSAKKRNRKILIIASACLIVFFAIILITSRASMEIIAFFAVMLLVFVLVVPLMQKVILKQQAKTQIKKLGNDFFASEKCVELTDDSLISISSLATSNVNYKNIVGTYRDDRFAYIEIKSGSKIFIPLSTPGINQFLEALQSKL